MKQPPFDGVAISESLYGSGQEQETDSKIANPCNNSNIYGRPSLIPGVQYPISEREERLLDIAYQKGYSDSMRMNRAGRLVENDPLLDILRKRMEEIRRDGIRKGKIKPVTEEERALV